MILNRYERMVAKRYLLPGKGEGFIFMVAGISLGAVALGVAALIVVMSVMNGFRAELFDKIVGLNGHAVLQGFDNRLSDWRQITVAARNTPGVTSALPLIEQPLMASANGRVEGVLLRGVRVADIRANKLITDNVKSGDIASVAVGSNNVAIGSQLARNLGAYPGSEISLISPEGRATPVGTVPRIVTYRVGAVFEVGVYDYDSAFVVMPMEDAQTLLMMGDEVGMIEVQTTDPDNVERILAPLNNAMQGKGVIRSWKQMNSALFDALQVERVAMFFVLCLIILVAVFNILSSLIMLVRAKTRDIAILRTMGASSRGLMKVFMTVGTVIGSLGILAGCVLAVIILAFRQSITNAFQWATGADIWDPSVRFLTEMPAKSDPVEVTAIVLVALALSFLATIFPARKAATTDPVQVLRYE